jgi:hypothetical protein
MVLKVMTLIIIIHCIQNFIPIDLTIIKMLRAKEDVGEAMVFNPKAKPHENPQIRIITKAKVVAYMPLFMNILLNCKN